MKPDAATDPAIDPAGDADHRQARVLLTLAESVAAHPDVSVLDQWCRSRIAGFKRPRVYRFIGESRMPRTATGKIQHRLLRERMLLNDGTLWEPPGT
jgi:acyl-CoA synthetase (AMP-forming)/AMP-acid ligase II